VIFCPHERAVRGRRKDEGGRRYASRLVKQEARGKKQEICFEYKWIGL
jgi:hypothetical protein